MAALIFLDVNGVRSLPPPDELEEITRAVASGIATKDRVIDWMKGQIG